MLPSLCRSGILINDSPMDSGDGVQVPAPYEPDRHADNAADIGTVVFLDHKKQPTEAILDSQGKWRCPRLPVLERVLNVLYEPGREEADRLTFGHSALIRVAKWFKGEVLLHCSSDDDISETDECIDSGKPEPSSAVRPTRS